VRTLHGVQISLQIGLLATLVSLTIGLTFGATAGYLGGRIDNLMMRFVDILYALPDIEFDRSQGLHSIPAALGVPRAIAVSRLLHLVTVSALALTVWAVGAGTLAWVGVAIAAALLAYEHSLVTRDDLSKLDAAFFTMNGVISIAFFACVLADRLLA
jgi:4-hydroxybenzoate polyprenyltransferase